MSRPRSRQRTNPPGTREGPRFPAPLQDHLWDLPRGSRRQKIKHPKRQLPGLSHRNSVGTLFFNVFNSSSKLAKTRVKRCVGRAGRCQAQRRFYRVAPHASGAGRHPLPRELHPSPVPWPPGFLHPREHRRGDGGDPGCCCCRPISAHTQLWLAASQRTSLPQPVAFVSAALFFQSPLSEGSRSPRRLFLSQHSQPPGPILIPFTKSHMAPPPPLPLFSFVGGSTQPPPASQELT